MNAIKAMTLIHPDVRKAYFDHACDVGEEEQELSTEVILAQGPNMGELVAELGKAKGRKTISRADLLESLLKLIPRESISFGKRIVGIEDHSSGVKVMFAGGAETNVDCLIGADGIHSVVRRYILGADHPTTEPVNHDGWQIYRTLVPMSVAKKEVNERWTRIVPVLLGPRGHVNCTPLSKGTRFSAGVAIKGAKFTESGIAPELDPELYKDYGEDAQQIARLVARDTSASWTAADHDHAPTYFRGRVTMVGDAAHSSLPFAGQGAAQALEDASVLDHLISCLTSASQVEALLAAYDAVRRPRSQTVVDMARKFGRIYAYSEGDMHEKPEKMRKFFKDATAYTNNADLEAQNEHAMVLFQRRLKGATEGSNSPIQSHTAP
jgi:salicylate hydroxylase